MKWIGNRESTNVDDRRGMSGRGLAVGGGIGGLIIYLLYALLTGSPIDPSQTQIDPGSQTTALSPQEQAADEERAKFVKVVLAETEDVWHKIFAENGGEYREPTLVLFRDVVQSSCGNASSASGPFYCPMDSKVYIDLSFYQELQERFRVEGDFPMAYVLAHEVGHHVQNLMGTAEKMNRLREQVSESEANRISVMMELQADFYAGVWANRTQKMKNNLEEGDIEEALNAANAIGDDRLQKQSTGYVVPDAFTHGTSAQRMYWFKKGYQTGDIKQGDTFNAKDL
ncbi:MAG TPA: neutral zinc metallopeptidase [Chitinophagaceae bacterium]|nr:neutral zinc metallopeptidase [Chitinophagaceae bacterium]